MSWSEETWDEQKAQIRDQLRTHWQRDQSREFARLKAQFDSGYDQRFITMEARKFGLSEPCIRWYEFSLYLDKLLWLQEHLPRYHNFSLVKLDAVPYLCADQMAQERFPTLISPRYQTARLQKLGKELARELDRSDKLTPAELMVQAVHRVYAELNPDGWVKGMYEC